MTKILLTGTSSLNKIHADAYAQLISCGYKRKCVSVGYKCSTSSLKRTPACGCDAIDDMYLK